MNAISCKFSEKTLQILCRVHHSLSVVVSVDPVHAADLIDVAGHQEVGVTRSIAVAVGRINVIDATARKADHAARAVTEVVRAVVTAPAVAGTTSTVKSANATATRRTTANHPSLHDQSTRTTSNLNVKAVPRLGTVTEQEMVLRVHRTMNRLAVVAERQMTTTKAVRCCCCGVLKFAVLSLRDGLRCDRSLFYRINIATVVCFIFFPV